jgi:hypothetical protein
MDFLERNYCRLPDLCVPALSLSLLERLLRRPLPDCRTQVAVCNLLASLSAAGGGNRWTVAAAGGITTVAAAMAAVPGDPALQEAGCHALANVAVDADNRRLVAVPAVLTPLLAALRTHRAVQASSVV